MYERSFISRKRCYYKFSAFINSFDSIFIATNIPIGLYFARKTYEVLPFPSIFII